MPFYSITQGTWKVGTFHGLSPFELQPLSNGPVITCESVVDQPSNFVAVRGFYQSLDVTLEHEIYAITVILKSSSAPHEAISMQWKSFGFYSFREMLINEML